MHGLMECPWKDPATVEEADGGWVVTTMQHGAIKCFYESAGIYDDRLIYEFHEDEGDAFRFEDREAALAVAMGANDPDTDILCRLARPRSVKELTELRDAAEAIKGQEERDGKAGKNKRLRQGGGLRAVSDLAGERRQADCEHRTERR